MMRVILTFLILASLCFSGCGPENPNSINIGFIGPLTGNAVDLGVGPAKAMELAVESYNERRTPQQPQVNLFIADDKWSGANALPLYESLRANHEIEVLFISHTDGTIALQERVLQDKVILINSLNNDALLSAMNENTFPIGKKTEETAEVVAARLVELGKRAVCGFNVTNSFMTISADALQASLKKQGIESRMIPVNINKSDYQNELEEFKTKGCDSLVFFGYKNLGFAMKQARELGMDVPFFATTTTLGKGYYENSEGYIEGTEFAFFTEDDGNYILAKELIESYENKFGSPPFSVWPAMQGYDAMNILLNVIEKTDPVNLRENLEQSLKTGLLDQKFFSGVCGNLAILKDGSSRGIYFSLYRVEGNGRIQKVER